MQITKAVVTPVELSLRQPAHMAGMPPVEKITAVFVRIETRSGHTAWGCGVAHVHLTGETPEHALQASLACAERAADLHPTNIEYSLAELAPLAAGSPAAACAFDLAFHDLLGLAADLPLHRLLGGFRTRIQTSVAVPAVPVEESVKIALNRARAGYRMLKIKGGLDPDLDVKRVRAIHRALPDHILRLDPDGAYTIQTALEVIRAVEGMVEMIEQPTPGDDLSGLGQVTGASTVPVLADQSVRGPQSLLELSGGRIVDGFSVKLATCGGLLCARQMDAIGRAARMTIMVSCIIEPALLTAAGLAFALSSPSVQYSDLDGHVDLLSDPTVPGFRMKDGWLTAAEVPGLGCTVDL